LAPEVVGGTSEESYRHAGPLSPLSTMFEPDLPDGKDGRDAIICRLPRDCTNEGGMERERNSSSFRRDILASPAPGSKRNEMSASSSVSEYIPSSSSSSPSKSHSAEIPRRMAQAYVNTVESGAARPPSDLILNESNMVEGPVDSDEILKLQQEIITHRRNPQINRHYTNSVGGMTARRKEGRNQASRHRLARVQTLSEKWVEYMGTLPATFSAP
jgi:hypothetical protein